MSQTLTQEDLDAILATINSGKPFVTLADGVAHGGTPGSSTATLAFSRMVGVSQTADTAAFSLTGNGAGPGIECLSGNNSPALYLACNSTNPSLAAIYCDTGVADQATILLNGRIALNGNGGTSSLLTIAPSGIETSPTVDIQASGSGGDGVRIASFGVGKHDINLVGSGDILGSLSGTIDGLTAVGLATLDSLLIESSISAGVGLTDDAGSQLTSINLRQALALILSTLAGALAGAAGTSLAIKPGGKPSGNTRVAATVDSDGNRSALTLKVPT